MHYYKDMTCWI